MDEKIDFISKNIDFINETDDIISFIYVNNINYSQNSNGLFINLSLLETKYVEGIYKLVNEKIFQDLDDEVDIPMNKYGGKTMIEKEKYIYLDPNLEKVLKHVFT
jgi:hypothetical protein